MHFKTLWFVAKENRKIKRKQVILVSTKKTQLDKTSASLIDYNYSTVVTETPLHLNKDINLLTN